MSFNDREKAFENKFSLDQESLFKIEARTSKLVGLWAAGKLGLTGAEADAYAKEVISANLDEPGYGDIKRKLADDFQKKNVPLDLEEIDKIILKSVDDATKQIESEKR